METENRCASLIPDGGNSFRTEYHDERPVQAIIRALSAIENCMVENVPPFSQYADPNALNRLIETARDSDQDVSVEVTIEDVDIAIDSDGTISIYESGSESNSENAE